MSTEALNKLLRDNPALYKALMAQVACEKSLYKFTETMWEFVEPANPFIGNWHIQVMCEHLEQVTAGNIMRLLINVPPGMAKSIILSVFWPAWEWIHYPSKRYLCTSYSSSLTERDNIRFRQVITSDLYRAMWGDRFGFSRDSFNLTKMGNDKTGWKIATSVGGVSTGERADAIICFGYDAKITTDIGCVSIGDIVSQRLQLRVAGYDHNDKQVVWQEIEEYEKNPSGEMIEIDYGDDKIICTIDHPIYVEGNGYIKAIDVREGDELISW